MKNAKFLNRPIVFDEPELILDSSAWLGHIPLAFWIVDALRPKNLVELGTLTGCSYAAFLQAVKTLKLDAACFAVDTWQGDPHAGFYGDEVYRDLAAFHDPRYASFSRLIRSTFDDALVHFPNRSIDLLHIDGYHTYEAITHDFNAWLPKVSDRGVMLFHDVNVRERDFGVWRFWEEVRARYPSFTFLHSHGLGVLAVGKKLPPAIRWLVSSHEDSPDVVNDVRRFFGRLGGHVIEGVERRQLSGQVARLSSEVGASQNQIAALTAECSILRSHLAERDEQTRSIASERQALRDQLSQIEQRESGQAQRIQVLEGEVSSAHSTLLQCESELAQTRGELEQQSVGIGSSVETAVRTLFVHAGGSKTGSSALQNFFEMHASRLESFGFAYEHKLNIKNEYQITSGNGRLLCEQLSSATAADNEIDSLVLSYFGRFNRAICSSEYFAEVGAHGWKKLYESSLRLGVKLKVIFYVRNVIPFLLSAYDQVIKRHGESRTFDEWVKAAEWQHVSSLQRIADELPKSSVHIVHYDRGGENLARGFLNILGVDASFEECSVDLTRRVNRSLSAEERGALTMANNALGGTYSNELSDLLIYAKPEVEGNWPLCNESTTNALLARFASQVGWVNNAFFNGQAVVSVLPIEPIKRVRREVPETKFASNSDVEMFAFDWAIEKLKTIQDETGQRIVNTLFAATQSDSIKLHPALPDDFDLLAYLLLNPDVLLAGVDPVLHFISEGEREGRRYKLLNRNSGAFGVLADSPQQVVGVLYCRVEALTQNVLKTEAEVQVLRGEVQQRQSEVAERDERIKFMDGELAQLRTDVARREEQVRVFEMAYEEIREKWDQSQQLLSENDEQKQVLANELAQAREELVQRSTQVQQIETEMQSLRDQVTQRQLEVAERENRIKVMDEALAQQRTDMVQREEQLSALESTHKQTQDQLAQVQAFLAERDQQIGELEQARAAAQWLISQRDTQLTALLQDLAQKDAELSIRESEAQKAAKLVSALEAKQNDLLETKTRLQEIEKRLAESQAQQATLRASLRESDIQSSNTLAAVAEKARTLRAELERFADTEQQNAMVLGERVKCFLTAEEIDALPAEVVIPAVQESAEMEVGRAQVLMQASYGNVVAIGDYVTAAATDSGHGQGEQPTTRRPLLVSNNTNAGRLESGGVQTEIDRARAELARAEANRAKAAAGSSALRHLMEKQKTDSDKLRGQVDEERSSLMVSNERVRERDLELAALAQLVADSESRVVSLSQALAGRDQHLMASNAKVSEAEARVSELLRSRSWRYTAPLRAGRRMPDATARVLTSIPVSAKRGIKTNLKGPVRTVAKLIKAQPYLKRRVAAWLDHFPGLRARLQFALASGVEMPVSQPAAELPAPITEAVVDVLPRESLRAEADVASSSLIAHIDSPTSRYISCGEVRFSGWFCHRDLRVVQLTLEYGSTRKDCHYGIERRDVHAAHTSYVNSLMSGFEVTFMVAPGKSPISLNATLENGVRCRFVPERSYVATPTLRLSSVGDVKNRNLIAETNVETLMERIQEGSNYLESAGKR